MAEIAFYLALCIELSIVILDKSAYIIRYEGLWFRVTFLLFGISLVVTKRNMKQWVMLILFCGIGLISYKVTTRNEILRWVIMIWACYGRDMKKVFRLTFWFTLIGSGILILLSLLGIYGEVAQTAVYRVEEAWQSGVEEVRYCFGMGHPNAFHCMMLALTWLGIYCYDYLLKWYSYLLILIGHVTVFYFTGSRTGLLMGIGSTLLVVFVKYIPGVKKAVWLYMGGIAVVIGAVLFSVFMAKYSIFHPLLEAIDGLLSNRILNLYYDNMNHEGMLHTWFLWGQERNTYFFDLGIVRFFYWFGIIPGVLYYGVQCILLWFNYRKKDWLTLLLVVFITIYSIFEAHYISDYSGRNYILLCLGMYIGDMLEDK